MKIHFAKDISKVNLTVAAAYQNENNKSKNSSIAKYNCRSTFFQTVKDFVWTDSFSAQQSEVMALPQPNSKTILLLGLGLPKKLTLEIIRRSVGSLVKQLNQKKISSFNIDLDSFTDKKNALPTLKAITEALILGNYQFDKYKSQKKSHEIAEVNISTKHLTAKIVDDCIQETKTVAESINQIRSYINECPGVLHSEFYAKLIAEDAKKLKHVKIKIFNKKEIISEKMNLFLSVNAGSAFEPRLVQLTYTPSKTTKNTKHFVVVGKGVTYDTGGYSLKPATSMTGMKGDMAGSATVYGAFKSAALNNSPHKITCLMVLTDNKINSLATVPDTIVTGRNGKTVEILNTDAEGRLILADALDFACDLKPDAIVDAATLTGACLVALGKEVCAVLGNNQKLIDKIINHAKSTDEYIWQLPIVQEYRDDIKSKVADIKNIGSPMRAGTAIGAAFLENFIKNDIPWAHLDIAGVSDDQSHLGYCPSHGASGVMVRTLYNFLMHG
jgi:leucyl aminopeptidase